jgi:hypothetical protein
MQGLGQYLFKPARTGPRHSNSDQRIILSIRHCALRSDTPANKVLTSSSLSESCTKIGDVPKSPVPTLAALVPSVGT